METDWPTLSKVSLAKPAGRLLCLCLLRPFDTTFGSLTVLPALGLSFWVQKADSGDFLSIYQIPLWANPDDEKFRSGIRRQSHAFRKMNGKNLPIT
jgi:hypothetical protein